MTGEQKEISDQEVEATTHVFSSFLDDTIMPTPPNMGNNFRHFQDLYRRVADFLDVSLGEVQDT